MERLCGKKSSIRLDGHLAGSIPANTLKGGRKMKKLKFFLITFLIFGIVAAVAADDGGEFFLPVVMGVKATPIPNPPTATPIPLPTLIPPETVVPMISPGE